MPKAVVFDVDGTLVDSVDHHAHAWVDAFRDFGHEVGFREVRAQIGKGGDQLMPVFLSPTELDREGEELEAHRSAIFKARYLPDVQAFDEVRTLFERLLADGKRIALASSAKQDELRIYERIAHVDDLVQTETTSEDADRSKPHPDIFTAALRQLKGVPRTEILVVGDTPYDALAAAKAGLRTVGLMSGGWSAEDLSRAGCIAVYHDASDLLAHYLESPLA